MATVIEKTSWADFKNTCVTVKNLSIQYVDSGDRYDIYGPDISDILWHYTLMKDGGSDETDFLNNVAPAANQSIRLASEVIYTNETYTTTSSLLSIRPETGNLNTRMISNLSINIQNTGNAAASISIFGSLDGINFNVSIVSGQSLGPGTGFHLQNTDSFQAISIQAQIPLLGSSTTLVSSAYGVL